MTLVEMMNPFTSKRTGEAPDEYHPVVAEKDVAVDYVVEEFMRLRRTEVDFEKVSLLVLTPAQVREAGIQIYQKCNAANNNKAGFMRRLVQASYLNGYNNFHLEFPRKQVLYVVEYEDMLALTCGSSEDPLRIIVRGSLGESAFRESAYVHASCDAGAIEFGPETKHCRMDLIDAFSVGEKTEDSYFHLQTGNWVGREAKRSTFIIEGDTIHNLGHGAIGSTFEVKGKVTGEVCATVARECTFILHGPVHRPADPKLACGHNAKDCTFKVGDEATYQDLRQRIGAYNTVERLNP